METAKFRVWNGREMVYDIMVGKFGIFYVNPEKGDGLNPKDTACLSENTTKYPEGTPLMRFTELPDINGKEIYEGDVTQLVLPNGEKRIFVVKIKKVIREVVNHPHFNDKKSKVSILGVVFSWNGYDLFPCVDFDRIPDNLKMEVIGNIYENPELLN